MFEYSWKRKDFSEIRGQLLRMFAVIPGHLFNRLPVGNIGWSSVGLTKKMPLPKDLSDYFKK